MCNSGTCSHELASGKCGKRPGDVCPEMAEDDDDLDRMEQAAIDQADAYAEHIYEQQRERRWQR